MIDVTLDHKIFILLALVLGVRAFLFEIKFVHERAWLSRKSGLFSIFLGCSFCNGFWVGLGGYLLVYGVDWVTLPFSLMAGSTSFYLNLATAKLKTTKQQ
ncbi:hypothetical protein [Niallia circulans]|uniref:hypothetical protein n=1 Tax=Niallia circulans TaxID=1397 RepID=UPI0026EB986E|nr:hypothetical protein [Niallia circulans]